MDADKTKVILVGNSTFSNWGGEEKKNIPNVEKNLERLKKIFINTDYFAIPNDTRHLVISNNETSQEILLKVKHETKSCADRSQFERLIFYYSGHGIPGEDRKLYLATSDTVRSDYEITAIDSTRLFSYLKGFGARELIVILDCCYAAQSKENLGDADSLIANSLPSEKQVLEDYEYGTYYLFAAGKDNVAKFNPRQPENPTYFTQALLNSIQSGTIAGNEFIAIGELYVQLKKEIEQLKNKENADIPDPRPLLEGDVNGFIFCRNIKFANQEDKDWEELVKDPMMEKIRLFEERYPSTRFETEKDELRIRLQEGMDALDDMEMAKTEKKSGKMKLATDIKKNYGDIPFIKKAADKFLREQTAISEENEKRLERGGAAATLSSAAESKGAAASTRADGFLNNRTDSRGELEIEKATAPHATSLQPVETISREALQTP